MTEQGNKYLYDILRSIELIESFTANTASFEDYLLDLKTQSAVERQPGIIGEAVNMFDALFPEESIKNARQIVGFRNRLIHAYDSIDSAIVWAILRNHLTPLKIEVTEKPKS